MDEKGKVDQHLKELMRSIFEAKQAYTIWKVIAYSRSTSVVSEELAHKYVEIQKTAPAFFIITERACLVTFVLFILQPFDRDGRAYSLLKIDREKTNAFEIKHADVFQSLKIVRDKLFAHKDEVKSETDFKAELPPIEKLDAFLDELYGFYNSITHEIQNAATIFDASTDDLLDEIEGLFINIARGDEMRRAEIDKRWRWLENDKKMSTVFKAKKHRLS